MRLLIVFALMAAVIAVDQATKWWAWRHISGTNINPGGDFLIGPTMGSWYARPVTGALLDLVDFGLVSFAAVALLRRRPPVAVTVCGSLMVGGWTSNLLDRLGMHYWTAPGSIRGAVDFIGLAGHYWNVADFVILGATPLFLAAIAIQVVRAVRQPAAEPATPAKLDFPQARTPIVALAGAVVITTVALGAEHHGSLARPLHSTTSSGHHAPHPRSPHSTPSTAAGRSG